jgi:hypothetical protein
MFPGQRAADPGLSDLPHPAALAGIVEQPGDQLGEV